MKKFKASVVIKTDALDQGSIVTVLTYQNNSCLCLMSNGRLIEVHPVHLKALKKKKKKKKTFQEITRKYMLRDAQMFESIADKLKDNTEYLLDIKHTGLGFKVETDQSDRYREYIKLRAEMLQECVEMYDPSVNNLFINRLNKIK